MIENELDVYSFIKYRDQGIILSSKVAHGAMFYRELLLNDFSTIIVKVGGVREEKSLWN